jgi:hypothetical protein
MTTDQNIPGPPTAPRVDRARDRARGLVTGPEGMPPLVGSQPPPPRRRRRRLLLPLVSVVAVGFVASALADSGDDSAPRRDPGTEVTGPASLSPIDLQPGDCYNSASLPADGSDTRIYSVEAVPCTDPHTAQVVTRLGYAGQAYDVVETRASQDCAREAQAKVRPGLLADQAYRLGHIHPTAGSWQQSPSVACVIATETPVTGSWLL